MAAAPNDREFLDLIDAYCEGALDAEQTARLEAFILRDAEARRRFIVCLQVHAATERSWESSLGSASERDSAGVERSVDAGAAKPAETTSRSSPVLGFLGGVVDYVSQSRTLMFWLIFGTLGLYFAVQFGSLILSRFWAQNAALIVDNGGVGTEKHGQASIQPGATEKVIAHLTDDVDCQWQFADSRAVSTLPLAAEFHAGQKLNLASGLAELTFDSGAKVILHAPARFDVRDELGGDLQRGKLTAKVPHHSTERGAAGFTINTPGGKVVDLGTEFGVKVLDDGVMNVIVYVGDVQVESGAGGGKGAGGKGSDGTDQPKVVHVHAGQAITVGPDHIAKPIPPENERFIRDLAPLSDKTKIKSEAAYGEFMKSLKPVVWLRMEGKETDRVLHDDMGGPDAKLAWDGPGNPFVKGPIGKGLLVRGAILKDYAILPDYPKAEHGKLSVVAWAYADSLPVWASLAKNWGNEFGDGQFQFGLFGADRTADLSLKVSQSDKQQISIREGAGHSFPLHEWQHVAFTTDGSITRLYRQGREVASGKHNGLLYPVKIPALGIGVKTDETGTAPAPSFAGYWDGKLDEIAIFNDTLSAEDIKKLASAAPR